MDLVEIRKYLHAHPELSGQEVHTAEYLRELLSALAPDELLTGLGGHGIAAVFQGTAPGPTLLFRAEMDALSIIEENNFAHQSVYQGLSHKCGHDGHMAILVGLAQRLSNQRPTSGKVICLFQPSEENGEGAKAVIQSPEFASIAPDYAFALHNLPGYPLGQVVLKKGPITAAVKSLIIKLKGKTAHAAEPEHGINPAFSMANTIKYLQKIDEPNPESEDFFIVTPIYMNLGEKSYGVAAGYGELHLTMRAWNQKVMNKKVNKLMNKLDKITHKSNLQVAVSRTDEFFSNTNHPNAVDKIKEACQKLGYPVHLRKFPLKWGEDFGAFTQNIEGAFIGLGAGQKHPALHNPDFDFPDELIPIGVNLFQEIAETYTRPF